MQPDPIDGTTILLGDIDTQLKTKRLSRQEALSLRVNRELLVAMQSMRRDVDKLKRHDMIDWTLKNPAWASMFSIAVLMVIPWVEKLRKLALQAFIHSVFGVVIPIDSLP